MLKSRILTVLVILPLFLAALWLLPNRYWTLLLIALLGVAAWEWCQLARFTPAWRWGWLGFMLLSCLALTFGEYLGALALPLYTIALLFWIVLAPFWRGRRWKVAHPAALAVVGAVVLLPLWAALAQLQRAPALSLLLLAIIWVADSAAYFVGRKFGTHKLAPAISPGKTWEGVAGALAGAAVYLELIRLAFPAASAPLHGFAGLATVLAIVLLGIEGDLFESWLKRQAGVKDSGSILPGHGGMLDRIDALTSSMPAAAFALMMLR